MLKRELRLRRKSEFRSVYDKGQSFPGKHVVVFVRTGTTKYAFVASKKVGKAVERNRAKRLMREIIRTHLRYIKTDVQVILIARPSIKGKSYWEVENSLLKLLHRAKVWQTEKL